MAAWVVEQDKKSSEFDAGKIPLRRLKQKSVLRLCGLCRSFRLTCTGKPFILETDRQPLQYLQRAKMANRRLMHWALLLQPFQFPRREAGDVCCLPPVWNLRAVI